MTRPGKLSVPIGHGAFPSLGNTGAGKSTLVAKLRLGGSCGETQCDSTDLLPSRKPSLSLNQ